jgi:hypothetical protein
MTIILVITELEHKTIKKKKQSRTTWFIEHNFLLLVMMVA